ncbi:MAG: DUF11 domain-containing protein [Aeromicrobium erythreum]
MHLSLRTALIGAAAALASATALVTPAQAAPGDAFDPARPQIFIGQGDPTQLSIAEPDANGNFTFRNEGGAVQAGDPRYNAIGYNTADNYLYGIANATRGSIPAGAVVRIGQEGVVTRVGTSTFDSELNIGAFGPGGRLYVANTVGTQLLAIDVTTGQQVDAQTLSQSLNTLGRVSDWAFTQGYLWGIGDNRTLVRVDPATGTVADFALTADQVSAGFAGAAWTYLDGTLGFSHNDSGRIDRIRITDPGSTQPGVTLLSSRTGPANTLNDGAASPGLPVDLQITKTSRGFAPGKTVTYTLTVKNNGDGYSTGWTATDSVPAELSDVTATSPDATCQVSDNDVTCTGGELAPGETATIIVTASVPADQTGSVENEATVEGNEPDPVASNNTDSVVDEVDEGDVGAGGADVPARPSVPAGGEGRLASSSTGPWVAGGVLVALLGGLAAGRRRLKH